MDPARRVFGSVRGLPVPCTLLHSRFRGVERKLPIDRVTAEPGDGAAHGCERGILGLRPAVLVRAAIHADWGAAGVRGVAGQFGGEPEPAAAGAAAAEPKHAIDVHVVPALRVLVAASRPLRIWRAISPAGVHQVPPGSWTSPSACGGRQETAGRRV